jgi:cysteinyl-tRNA synthetase
MKIYNTMTHRLEEFKSIEKNKVLMYVCGPTVYNYIHIGNARSIVSFDVIRRYLEYRGFEVNFVSNFTDIDDRIVKGAKAQHISTKEFSEHYIQAFYDDIDVLNVKRATTNPKASDYIELMIDFIKNLISKGFAYEADGDVYFRVSKAKDYGILANKNLEEMIEGASGRIGVEVTKKESAEDFALWKSVSGDRVEDKYESPWGAGRPGWHLECSVMSTSLLGPTLDIHGGGADLEFPHHTNEIAQSEAFTGKKFVNYWIHNGFVNINGDKMSKSLGNFKTVHDILDDGVDSQVLRFFLATTHYRKPLDYTDDSLKRAATNFRKLENAYQNIDITFDDDLTELSNFRTKFIKSMDEDFNIANGMTVIYDFVNWINKGHGGSATKKLFDEILGILGIKFIENDFPSLVYHLLSERQRAKNVGNFIQADSIRNQLKEQGIGIRDTKGGSFPFYE